MDTEKKQKKNRLWILPGGWLLFSAVMCLILIPFCLMPGKQEKSNDLGGESTEKKYELKEEVFFIDETDVFLTNPNKKLEDVSVLFFLPEGKKFVDYEQGAYWPRRHEINQVIISKSEIYHNEGTKKKLSLKEKTEWLQGMAEAGWIDNPEIGIDEMPKLSLTKNGSEYVFSGEYEGTLYTKEVDDVCELTVQYAREKRWTGFKVMIAVSICVSVLICISMMKKKIKMAAGSVGVGAAILICVFAFVMV